MMPTATGEPVGIEELFADPPAALATVARLAEQQLPAENECVRRYANTQVHREGCTPTPENHETFALTPSGLAVGFPVEQVASLVCGRVSTTVPYRALRPHLPARRTPRGRGPCATLLTSRRRPGSVP
jgi:hypothetical protein